MFSVNLRYSARLQSAIQFFERDQEPTHCSTFSVCFYISTLKANWVVLRNCKWSLQLSLARTPLPLAFPSDRSPSFPFCYREDMHACQRISRLRGCYHRECT